jgi:CRISPR-associated endonuclease/helicase Cas3
MGMGKTEAALFAAYRLLCCGKASGLYFALPTQVTSNKIHTRVARFLERIYTGRNADRHISPRLVHAHAWLTDDTLHHPVYEDKTNPEGSDWFASAKRALLAPFGVGTIDQALLGVVNVKHFFVRRFALAGKVVILDEVHSYDLYTGTLINELCSVLEALGCTVILLSATLGTETRTKLLRLSPDNAEVEGAYPLLSGRTAAGILSPVRVEPPEEKCIFIKWKTIPQAIEHALHAAHAGALVLWVCDTVGNAQSTYQDLCRCMENGGPECGLLHSAFPFFMREALETYWLEHFGKDRRQTSGAILVSTQIVEQSVDLDADVLVTELAPTDMLLQRIGRLWRHKREQRPAARPECWLLTEGGAPPTAEIDCDTLVKAFGAKALVYEPFILLQTLSLWKGMTRIRLPGDIRNLIAATYATQEYDEDWEKYLLEFEGRAVGKVQMARMAMNLWEPAFDDARYVQTRLADFPEAGLVLCRERAGRDLTLLDGSRVRLTGKRCLKTSKALHRCLVKVPAHVLREKCYDDILAVDVKAI